MKSSSVSIKGAFVVMLVAVMAMFALAGCAGGAASSSESSGSDSASSESASSSSSSSSVETLSSSAASRSSSSASSAASSSASSASSGTSTSGSYKTYTNDKEGYMFEIDSSFVAETNGSDVRVYTEKSGQVPYFNLSLARNTSGQTDEDILNGVGKNLIEQYGDAIVKGPVANTVQLSNRQVKGIELVVQEGTTQVAVYQYVEVINGSFFMWTGIASYDDMVTPAAMQHAMDTLQFKTA